MARDLVDSLAKYVIAFTVVIGCFYQIHTGAATDLTQAWAMLALIVGWLIRDTAGNSATANLVRAQAALPTVTTSAGPPQVTTVSPTQPDGGTP